MLYILLYSKFLLFSFLFLIYKKHLDWMDPLLVLRNLNLLKAKINSIFKTSLNSLQCWLLGLIQYNILVKEGLLNNIWPKLANILKVFLSSPKIFKRHLTFYQSLLIDNPLNWLCSFFLARSAERLHSLYGS